MKAKIDLIMICAGSQGQRDKTHVPLGLLYIGSVLKRAGYDVKIWHPLPCEYQRTLDEIVQRRPLWIGLSVLSGMTTHYAALFSGLLKNRMPEIPIVWGGHHASAIPEDCLNESFIDYVVVGEGEETALELSEALLQKSGVSHIEGIGYKSSEGQAVLSQKRAFTEDLDKYELDWSLINVEEYKQKTISGHIPISFFSSRGCPYQCSFCSTPTYTGHKYRVHSVGYVMANLMYLKNKHGINSVLFSDDNFMLDEKRGLEIIRQLSSKSLLIGTLDMRLNQINENVLAEFARSGVNGIFFGYESGNERILTLLNKGINKDLIDDKVRLITKYNIPVWASGIIGVPTETKQEIYNTIDYSMQLRDRLPDRSTVAVFRYVPLPGTKICDLAVKEGFVYPKSAGEWKKTDPIGPFYSMREWLKWVTVDDERYFAIFQEMSRNGMLNLTRSHSPLVSRINNVCVRRMRAKVKRRIAKWDAEIRCFSFLRNIYGKVRYGRDIGLKSEAIKNV